MILCVFAGESTITRGQPSAPTSVGDSSLTRFRYWNLPFLLPVPRLRGGCGQPLLEPALDGVPSPPDPIVSALRVTAEPRASSGPLEPTVSRSDTRNHHVHTDRIDVGSLGCPA